MRRAKDTVTTIYAEAARASDKRRKDLAAHALWSESERALRAMIALAESELAIKPELLDSDPWLLNVGNGTVDLMTGELHPHRPEEFLTKLAPGEFDPDSTHPVWNAFLERMVPDNDLRAFLQRAAGYTLTGDTSEEVLFFVHGPTAAGKSSYAEAQKATLGDYAATCDFETFLRKRSDGGVRNDIARLMGVRMALSLEVDEGRDLAEALVKNLTGGDTISARFLYQEFFEFKPSFKLWLVANDKPRANSEDSALWRRILIVPFPVSLPEDERDPALKDLLVHDQHVRSAILAWAIRGLREWFERGLDPPDAVRQATEAYRDECDHVPEFLAECCTLAPNAAVATSRLRERYATWCKATGNRQLSDRALASALQKGRSDVRPMRKGKGRRFWRGLTVADVADGEPISMNFSRARDEGEFVETDPQSATCATHGWLLESAGGDDA
jgi:putative DNA primase/helicase